jgi:hypothetical protein
MLYQITISRAGTELEVVVIEADSALAAINALDAAREKFTVQLSHGSEETIIALWSGFEYEARQISAATTTTTVTPDGT